MTSLYKSLLLLAALLPWASLAALHADEKKSDVPAGYEEAAEPEKEEADKPQPAEAKAEKQEADVPVGYEDSGEAGKRKKRANGLLIAPAAPIPAADGKALAKADKMFAENAQLKALAAQMRQQLKPYFAAELNFAKTVCQPNPEQLKKMKALATPELDKVIRALAIQQAPQMGFVVRGRRVQQESENLLKGFETAANRIVSQVFSAEMVELYQVEQNHRIGFRAYAGAMALVAHLDTQFRLSPKQREALTDSIQQQWQPSWQRYLQIMASNPQFFPPVPDEAVLPHLNDIQTKQWKARQRHRLGFNWQNLNNRGFFRKMEQEIDWFEKPDDEEQANGFRDFYAPKEVVEAADEEDEE